MHQPIQGHPPQNLTLTDASQPIARTHSTVLKHPPFFSSKEITHPAAQQGVPLGHASKTLMQCQVLKPNCNEPLFIFIYLKHRSCHDGVSSFPADINIPHIVLGDNRVQRLSSHHQRRHRNHPQASLPAGHSNVSDDALPIIFNIACDHVVKLTLPRKRFSEHLVQTEDLAGLTFEAKSFKKKCIHGWPADGTVSRARVENSTIWDETGKEIFTAGLL